MFFRAQNLSQALYIFRNSCYHLPQQIRQAIKNEQYSRLQLLYANQSAYNFFLAIIFLAIMILIHFKQKNQTFDEWLISRRGPTRWSFYFGLIIAFMAFGVFNRSSFIYFQF